MEVLRGLAVLACLLPPLALGAAWARRAWRSSDAHTCLALGGLAGLSAHLVALNALSYLILPGTAAAALLGIECAALLLCFLFGRESLRLDFAACRDDVKAVWPWLLPVAGLWIIHLLYQGGSDQLFHASLCKPLEIAGLPNTHPYDTAQVLIYHYGLNLLGASLGGFTGLEPWLAMHVTMAVLVPLALGGCVEFLRAAAARDGRTPSRAYVLGGTLLFALGGNLRWTAVLVGNEPLFMPGDPRFACDGLGAVFAAPALLSGWAWLIGIFAMALRWPEGDAPGRGFSPAIPLGLALAAVNLLAEQAALAAAVALTVFAISRLRKGWSATRDLIGAGVLGLGVALVQGGMAAGAALGLTADANIRFAWTGTFAPSFPSIAERLYPGDAGYAAMWWQDYAHTLLLLPLFAAWALKPRAPAAVRWLVGATLPGALGALYLTLSLNEYDLFRFYQLYFTAAMLATGVWVAHYVSGARRGLAWAAVIALGVLCLQGVRTTAAGVLLLYDELPYRYDAGQIEALKAIDDAGRSGEGILSQSSRTPYHLPASPGVLGKAVFASDPNTQTTAFRGRAWERALACPSPGNLRTARTRNVGLEPAYLANGLPLLEGFSWFERRGPFGANPRYYVYRFTGEWAARDEAPWRLRSMERFAVTGDSTLGGRTLSMQALSALYDGDPLTAVPLPVDALSGEGLVLELANDPAANAHPNGPWLVWVLAAEIDEGFAKRSLEICIQEMSGATWSSVMLLENGEFWEDPQRPRAWGRLFRGAKPVRVRIQLTEANGAAKVDWAEVYAGYAATVDDE
ncbi:MAG: hypothetical protein L6R28_12040 [Planctomycetes bacterium]|nr:hypothetical protein [Planctomycetota bacterium]